MGTVYAIVPHRYRYKGRHRAQASFAHAASRGLAVSLLSAIWLGFATVGVISTVHLGR